MGALTAIKMDAAWELPSGLSSGAGNQRSYGSKNLVGGNGTALDSSKVSAGMTVIDTTGTPGYLTAD